MKPTLLFLNLLLLCISGYAQTWDDTVRSIEKIMERYKPSSPGAQLAISRNGQVIYSKAWGMADLEHKAALTTTSPTEAGSVSKQFTAAAILLLEQEGKLSLNDNVRKYLPELPDYGTPITLRQMMQHTSGLKDWGSIVSLAGWPRGTKTYNNDDALYIVSLQKTLNNKPGAEFLYSNSGYNLMAVIVERVSGMSLAEYTRKKIFEPAGMTNTEWRDNFKKVVPNRALSYAKAGGNYLTNMPNEYVYGNGGLLTTAEDLLKWNNYYLGGKFGSPSLRDKQLATTPLNNGVPNGYAAGLFVRKVNGIDIIAHDGATASYRANLEYFPSLGLSIAWLSNTSEFDGGSSVPGAIRNLFIRPQQVEGIVDPNPFTVSTDVMKQYTGWYRNEKTGSGVKVYVQNDKLLVSQFGATTPISDRMFGAGSNRLVFTAGKKNMLFITAARDTTHFTGVDSATLTADKMTEYVGEYYSEEAEAKVFVIIKNGQLMVHQKPKTELLLRPTYKDGFDYPAGSVQFERDKKNKVILFKTSSSRARNVVFKKVGV
ncbi:MAG TPA: serine hydrolase domain-containing protein [Chitinophagaceae bacterium]|nr:serine hydrolase domain-containing protein [Chitinophagaceae bacterium]